MKEEELGKNAKIQVLPTCEVDLKCKSSYSSLALSVYWLRLKCSICSWFSDQSKFVGSKQSTVCTYCFAVGFGCYDFMAVLLFG